MGNYAENVLGAIDLIVQERMKDLKFDKTIVCSIVENLGEGVYLVNDGNTTFEAVADILSYPIGFQVNVLIPQGDYNNQKTITGRYINKSIGENGVRYMTPFDNCLDVSGNIIEDIGDFSLLANGNIASINIWKKDLSGQDVAGYDYIGLSADFYAALSEFNPIFGNYGLELVIDGIEKNSDDILRKYSFKLDSSDMYGNPYLFETYFNQQKIFKIDNFKAINSIYLNFYQDSNFKYEYEENGSAITDFIPTTMGEGAFATEMKANLKVKNFYMFFGYELDKLATDTVLLLTTGSEKYNHTEDTEFNKRDLMVKWVRREGNTAYTMEEDMLDPSMRVHWYRYDETFEKDPIAGDNWEELPNSWSSFEYKDIPLRVREKGEEKFKVIITKGNIDETTTVVEEAGLVERFESNELTFTSAVPIVDHDTADRLTGLKISYVNDNYQGKYRIYGENKELKNAAEAIITRALAPSLELHEMPVEISEEDIVTWYVPKNATMIVLAETSETAKIEETPDYYVVTKSGKYPVELSYKIKNLYLETNVNNTINCLLYRKGNGITYTASTTMTFGTTGTAGTDYTFVIESEDGNEVYTAEDGKNLKFVARLYDYNDEPVEWGNQTIKWSWATDTIHAFSFVNDIVEGTRIELSPNDNSNENDYRYNILKANVTTKTKYKTKTPKLDDNGNYLDSNNAIIKPDKNGEIDKTAIVWIEAEVEQNVSMDAYYSIPVRTAPEYYISGATSVWYDSAGTNPSYAKDKYEIFGIKGNISPVWEVVYADSSAVAYYPQIVKVNGDYLLRPKNMYIQDIPNTIAIRCFDSITKALLWVQPLIIRQDKYSSSLLNQWDGSLTIDEKNGTILSTMVGAGKKEIDNTFSGVLMGDVQTAANMNATGIGLYGFNHGEQSFNFSVDGTAFIGKAGRGRIMFDGNNGTITSQGFEVAKQGMKIDLNTGKLESKNIGGSITMTPEDADNLFVIKDKDNNTIMHVSNDKYYLQSSSYVEDNIGMKINLANGVIESMNSAGAIKIDPTNTNRLFTIDYRKAKDNGSGYDKTTLMKIGADSYYLQSANYASGSAGMKINLIDGTIDAAKFKLSSDGKITTTGGTIGGWTINGDSLSSSGITIHSNGNISSSGWSINGNGSASFNNVTVTGGSFSIGSNFSVNTSGNLIASSATITGTINATGGTFTGPINAGGNISCSSLTVNGKAYSMTETYVISGLTAARESPRTLNYIDSQYTLSGDLIKGYTLTKESVSRTIGLHGDVFVGAQWKKIYYLGTENSSGTV